jgi:hypothetical protein
MHLRHHARAGMALAAAYAVALQAILLTYGVPLAGAGGASAFPICSQAAGHSAPAGHGQDCLESCLTGCCGSAPVCPMPAAASVAAPEQALAITPALGAWPQPVARVTYAHCSRAPPLA